MRVLAAVIRDSDRYLLCRRPRHKRHGGLWEFPGGKLEPDETLLQAAQRELKEELGVDTVAVGARLFAHHDPESPFLIEFVAVEVKGTPRALEHEEVRWVRAGEGADLEFAPSDRVFWERWVRTDMAADGGGRPRGS